MWTYHTHFHGGYRYFITFIDDYSRFGWIDLLHEKSNSLNAFKSFKAAIELKTGKKIKCVRFDRGGVYYGIYDETGRNPRPFARFLYEWDIEAHYAWYSSAKWSCRNEESHSFRDATLI